MEYATCVKLLNYPDKSGDAGKVLTPEAASAMPTVSADGKTYTFTVPAGKYKFNTGEPVTAATFQHALERDLSPKQASYFGATVVILILVSLLPPNRPDRWLRFASGDSAQ